MVLTLHFEHIIIVILNIMIIIFPKCPTFKQRHMDILWTTFKNHFIKRHMDVL